MQKYKSYPRCRFSAESLREAVEELRDISRAADEDIHFSNLEIDHEDSTWTHDEFDEFISDYRKFAKDASIILTGRTYSLRLHFYASSLRTSVSVQAPDRGAIHKIFEIFERNVASARLPAGDEAESKAEVCIFIGHGRSTDWKELKEHLREKHQFDVRAYETGARAGHAIRDILDELITSASFALLVMTGEDEQADGQIRSRQNVVHETGLFQGRLGFSKAIVLLEEGTETFSNLDGIQYIEFSKGRIRETFGEVLAVIKREFGA